MKAKAVLIFICSVLIFFSVDTQRSYPVTFLIPSNNQKTHCYMELIFLTLEELMLLSSSKFCYNRKPSEKTRGRIFKLDVWKLVSYVNSFRKESDCW